MFIVTFARSALVFTQFVVIQILFYLKCDLCGLLVCMVLGKAVTQDVPPKGLAGTPVTKLFFSLICQVLRGMFLGLPLNVVFGSNTLHPC